MHNSSLLSRPAAADFLGVRVETVDTAVSMGQLPVVRIGTRSYIPRAKLEELLAGKYETEPGRQVA